MLRGADPVKDQSYFLMGTTQEQLQYLRFPLGGLSKDQTRSLAQYFNLSVTDKPDSQDICFVPQGDYRTVVLRHRPDALKSGEIIHKTQGVIGTHEGIINYTVGQRRGLLISWPHPLFVIGIEAQSHRVIVGGYQDLSCQKISLRQVNWMIDIPEQGVDLVQLWGVNILVKYRSGQIPLRIESLVFLGGGMVIHFSNPVYGISTGQICALYIGEQVLGGGLIDEALSKGYEEYLNSVVCN
jgi:tRNA-uridine 2-sulfurtransferase